MATRETPEALRRLAFLYLKLGRYLEAVPIYSKLTDAPGSDAGSLVNLGCAKAALGDDAGAVDSDRRAVALDPKLLEARLDLGIALYRTGDEAGCVEMLAAYLAAAPRGTAERVRKFLASLGWKEPEAAPVGGLPALPAPAPGGSL